MIAITGATGRTGRTAVGALLQNGARVRLIGRDSERLKPILKNGAEPWVGDINDASFLTRALEGATAAYLVVPEDTSLPDLRAHQERVTDSFATAVSKAKVPYVIALSSIGAQHPSKTGPIVGLHNLEQKLNAVSGLNVLFLRPGFYMENLLLSLAPLCSMGMLPGGIRGDFSMPWIATRDIGEYAARRLLSLDFSGSSVQELHGQRDISMNEAAAIVGQAIGKPDLRYQQVPFSALEASLLQMGMPGKTVALLIEMWNGANKNLIVPQQTRSSENTTVTTLETFVAEVFAPAYRAALARNR